MNYEYCHRNRLEEPHAYMYTPFLGESLLRGYADSRLTAMRACSGAVDRGSESDLALIPLATHALDRLLGPDFRAIASGFSASATAGHATSAGGARAEQSPPTTAGLRPLTLKMPIRTVDLLNGLITAQLADIDSDAEFKWLDRLVQKFEVSKKLYDAYPAGFGKGEGGNTTLRLYWLFALALTIHYCRSGNLKYLNALLKVCDLLCSLPGDLLTEQVPASGFLLLLAAELRCVRTLANRSEVRFALD